MKSTYLDAIRNAVSSVRNKVSTFATATAAVLCGHKNYDEEITVSLRGGDLSITCKNDGGVMMRGAAAKVFDGDIDLGFLHK